MDSFIKKGTQSKPTYTLKHIFCKIPSCPLCRKGKGHGPYWHASYEINGKTQTIFLGKEFNPVNIKSEQYENRTQSEQTTAFKTKTDTQGFGSKRFKYTTPDKQPSENNTLNTWQQPLKQNPNLNTRNVPPSKLDFEKDLRTLKGTSQPKHLKLLYRKLTKKYHPDKYPGIGHINAWMAEINGQYTELKKAAGL